MSKRKAKAAKFPETIYATRHTNRNNADPWFELHTKVENISENSDGELVAVYRLDLTRRFTVEKSLSRKNT